MFKFYSRVAENNLLSNTKRKKNKKLSTIPFTLFDPHYPMANLTIQAKTILGLFVIKNTVNQLFKLLLYENCMVKINTYFVLIHILSYGYIHFYQNNHMYSLQTVLVLSNCK